GSLSASPRAAGKSRLAASAADAQQMRALEFARASLRTKSPRPFGASILHTKSGKLLLRALNALRKKTEPSAQPERRPGRRATNRLKQVSLAGYPLYTSGEPCPMCMSAVSWAGLDSVLYGARIADASRHCSQIQISAIEVAARSDMSCKVDRPLLRDEC